MFEDKRPGSKLYGGTKKYGLHCNGRTQKLSSEEYLPRETKSVSNFGGNEVH